MLIKVNASDEGWTKPRVLYLRIPYSYSFLRVLNFAICKKIAKINTCVKKECEN